MKFFLPLAADTAQTERVYSRIIEQLTSIGCQISDKRIYKVIYKRERKLVSDTVGAAADNGEIVLAIVKNDVGYFICTYSQGAVWGEPITARYAMVESVEYFDPTGGLKSKPSCRSHRPARTEG